MVIISGTWYEFNEVVGEWWMDRSINLVSFDRSIGIRIMRILS